MPDLGALGPSLAVGLVLVVMLWFTFGTQRNIRKGNEVLRWLRDALPMLGPRTTLRWLGSSAVELGISEGTDPFRDVTIVVVLEPRDVGLLWAWARSRGRRDFVIVRGNLRRAPTGTVEIADPRGWTGRLDGPDESGWRSLRSPGGGIVARAAGTIDDRAALDAWQRLDHASGGVWRLTVQPVVPHIEVHVRPPDLARVPAQRLVSAVRDLAGHVSREPRTR
jgi:hypothetical protein